MPWMHEVAITTADRDRRLDKFLLMYLNNASRSFIYKLLRKKRIKLNGKRADGGELLQTGDILRFYLSQETLSACRKERTVDPMFTGRKAASPEVDGRGNLSSWGEMPSGSNVLVSDPLDIVFEDEHLLVVNKPAGMPSHGGMTGKDIHLLALVLHYLRESGAYPTDAAFVPALCNRLDVNTSGLVICGKNYQALRAVNTIFADASTIPEAYTHAATTKSMRNVPGSAVVKEYLAVVDGEIRGSATLEGYYQKDTAANIAKITNASCAAVASAADEANTDAPLVITAYKSLAVSKGRTLLSVSPMTGRSHQIRAHLAAIGHPLSGDKKYGGRPISYAKAQLLHCRCLTLAEHSGLPYTGGITWTADPPENFTRCLQELFNFAIEEISMHI